jgi:hypothetical protein
MGLPNTKKCFRTAKSCRTVTNNVQVRLLKAEVVRIQCLITFRITEKHRDRNQDNLAVSVWGNNNVIANLIPTLQRSNRDK